MRDLPEWSAELIDLAFRAVADEGRRRLGAEATKALEAVVDGVRRLVIVQYVVMSACFLWAASFLSSALLVAVRWEALRDREWPRELLVSLGVWAFASAVLAVTVRRSLWMRALGAVRRKGRDVEPAAPLGEAEVAAIVERSLRDHDRRLRDDLGTLIGAEVRAALRESHAGEPTPLRREGP